MTPELWQRLKPLYEAALGIPEDARPDFLSNACGNDLELRAELESLLRASDSGPGELDAPILELAKIFHAKERTLVKGQVILNRFEVISSLGAGGMGEVYRAQDRRLDRIVALKVLSSEFSGDAELRKRLHREAHAISVLSHPHICTLYDLGEVDGADFLVMEYVEGETLQARLRRGPLGIDLTLRYGAEIAAALDHAHRLGVVHRDLKPGNIMITKSGVKLLDFGLAKLFLRNTASNHAPTEEQLTEKGTILGTVQYMAPEQLEGREADPRSDIFALGVVLYEMATGRAAFPANSRAGQIAAILTSEPPPVSNLQETSPPALDRVVKQCLEKDADARWQSAADLARELTWIAEAGSQAETAIRSKPRGLRQYAALAAALLMVAGAAGWLAIRWLGKPAPAQPMRFTLTPPDNASFDYIALSPDGSHLAFLSELPGETQGLWVRSLDSSNAQFFPDTKDAAVPFWSPDGRYVAYFASNRLKRVAISGGAPEVLCSVPYAEQGAWNRDGVVLFSSQVYQPIRSVNLRDCSVKAVTQFSFATRDIGNGQASFLPDQRHFLWVLNRNSPLVRHDIYVGSLEPEASRLLIQNAGMPQYVPPGRLAFVRDGKLLAQDFDPKTFRLAGEAFPLVGESIESDFFSGSATYSAASPKLLVYKPDVKQTFRMGWLDRQGHAVGNLAESGFNRVLQLSPDDKRVLVARQSSDVRLESLWIYQFDSGTWSRFTFDPQPAMEARWSPDGKRVFFLGQDVKEFGIYSKAADGSGPEEKVFGHDRFLAVRAIASDGRSLLFEDMNPESAVDIWILPLSGERKPVPFLQTSFNEGNPVLSPDGRWVAYLSDKSGQFEIYVRPFPGSGPEEKISSAGTADWVDGGALIPVYWRRDEKELFHLSADWKVMSVNVSAGATFSAGVPHALFAVPPNSQVLVAPDGQRFLVNAPVQAKKPAPLEVVLNWTQNR